MDSTGIIQLRLGILILHQTFTVAIAAHVDTDAGIAMTGDVRMGQAVAGNCPVALAIRQMFYDRGTGSFTASSGIQMRAESRVPSGMIMPTSGCSTILRGKFSDCLHGFAFSLLIASSCMQPGIICMNSMRLPSGSPIQHCQFPSRPNCGSMRKEIPRARRSAAVA